MKAQSTESRGVPQILDGARDESRVAHLAHDDDGDGRLKQNVEKQGEDGPESDDAAHPDVTSTEEERAVPHRLRELARSHALGRASTAHGGVRIGIGIRRWLVHCGFVCIRRKENDDVRRCIRFPCRLQSAQSLFERGVHHLLLF